VACLDFIDRLLLVSPFNLRRINAAWLNVYKPFLPSANVGPAAGAALDPATGQPTVNAARVTAVVDAGTIEHGGRQHSHDSASLSEVPDSVRKIGSPQLARNGSSATPA
jgi:hypothetical protein